MFCTCILGSLWQGSNQILKPVLLPYDCLPRHTQGVSFLRYQLPRFKPAVPWKPDDSARLLAAMVATVRAKPPSPATALRTAAREACALPAAQGVRILSRPLQPGSHPLRALRTGEAQPTLPVREWAAVSCYADPVEVLAFAAMSMDSAKWQWTAVPANRARVVLESGALHYLRRALELGAAHAGRCAQPPHCANAPRGYLPHDTSADAGRSCRQRATSVTRRCCRSVPTAELNTSLLSHGACHVPCRAAH